jgi:hypothetical protein
MRRFKLSSGYGVLILLLLLIASPVFAQQSGSLEGRSLYDALKKFELRGKVSVSNLMFKRDRGEMVFNGDFYFAAPINGRVTGAIFIGKGMFTAAPPAELPFEQESLMRFLNEEVAESNFRTAVLRFNDDTFDVIGKKIDTGAAIPSEAVSLAAEFEPRLMKETGANVSSRLLVSFANNENPGFFLAQFDGGRRERFSYLLDPQTRLLGTAFGINGGEKMMLFKYAPQFYFNDVWMAAYSEEDFKSKEFKSNKGMFSDLFDLVSPKHYEMEIDLRHAKSFIGTKMRIDLEASVDNLRVLPMILNENITAFDDRRRTHSMRMQSAKCDDKELAFVQEPWEVGIAIVLPKPMKKGEKFSVELSLSGDILSDQKILQNCYYLQNALNWYPRHGYLKQATFDLTFRHQSGFKVASIGKLVREGEAWPGDKSDRLTQFKMDQPIAKASFAAGIFERHPKKRTPKYDLDLDLGSRKVLIDYYSLPGEVIPIKEDFTIAELSNCLKFFQKYFGPYPFDYFRAVIQPWMIVEEQRSIPTQVMIPKADSADKMVFEYIANMTSRQWWGDLVSWRSYRDQWMGHALARYSGMLYVRLRKDAGAQHDILESSRFRLTLPPSNDKGVAAGKVGEVGPLVLGQRLMSRTTWNAYFEMAFDKGGLVMRMLHFLFTDPSTDTGEGGQAFFTMLSDFVDKYKFKAASTEDFERVASEHFAKTPIAKNLGLKNLDWFFSEWVYQARLPSYRLEYKIEPGQNDQTILNWTVFQENAGPNWYMPLPVVIKFPGGKKATTVVYVQGKSTSNKITLPAKPSSVELDPEYWILTEKTSTKKM